MSITVELCNYDHRKKCLYCGYNDEGFCLEHISWCNLIVDRCPQFITTLTVRAKRKVNRCMVYKYIPSLDMIVNRSKKVYRVREGKELISRTLSEEQIDQIIEKYEEGANAEQIAEWYFVSPSTIRNHLRSRGKLGKKKKDTPAPPAETPVNEVLVNTPEPEEDPKPSAKENLINKVYEHTVEVVKQVITGQKEDKPMNCKSCMRLTEAYHKVEMESLKSNMNVTVELLEELMKDAKSMTSEQMAGDIERIVSFVKKNIAVQGAR